MSYASETKNELARIEPEKKCCMLAEIAGFMRFAGSVGLAGGGKFRMVMTTPNLAVVRHYKKLIRSYFGVDTDIEVGSGVSTADNTDVGHESVLYLRKRELSPLLDLLEVEPVEKLVGDEYGVPLLQRPDETLPHLHNLSLRRS